MRISNAQNIHQGGDTFKFKTYIMNRCPKTTANFSTLKRFIDKHVFLVGLVKKSDKSCFFHII